MKIIFLSFLLFFLPLLGFSQSFNEEKKSLVNYITRVYTNAPFDGGKKIEGEYTSCVVAISNEANINVALSRAWTDARITFGEPCVQFENIGVITANNNKEAQLFICRPLSEFIKDKYMAKPFEGAKIIQAPQKNILISVVTLDSANYPSVSLRDRAATMKARNFVNILTNGSTISSEMVMQTEIDKDNTSKTVSTEAMKELSMGFVGGMSLLNSFSSDPSRTTYIFYSENE